MASCNETMGETLQRLRRAQAADRTWADKRAARRKIKPASVSPAYTRGFDPRDKISSGHDVFASVAPSAEALAERDRLAMLEPVSLTAALLGDPLPGRSALDKRRAGA